MKKKVFTNRTLNLKRIKYIGLDMDHTLIRYKSNNFEALAYRIMLDKLVKDHGYPTTILKLKFDFDRAIRGLVIDKNKGNVLKLSRFAAIRESYHGGQPIDFSDQNQLYKSTYIDLRDADYDKVDTTFSISFAALFLQLVDLKDTTEKTTLPNYYTIANDISSVLDKAHRDGSIKNIVRENVSDYIIKDVNTVRGLQKFIKHGKKIFILTNSDFAYSKLLLDYAINPFLKKGETWQDIFEYVITSAQKPRFFYDKLKFLKVNPDDGSMTNFEGKLSPGVYQSGCASVFTNDLGLSPDDILYVGDHIYGDIVRLKKDCAWRTALVVEELEQEIRNIKKSLPLANKINSLMEKKIPIEAKIDQLISKQIETNTNKHQKNIEKLIKQISKIDRTLGPLIKKNHKMFNPYWGEVMRVGIEESYFAYQVERYACIYMAKLSDLLELSPRTYFRTNKRILPHEVIL